MNLWSETSTCAGCNGYVEDDVRLKVKPNLIWHVDCLFCFECSKSLANDGSCFIKFGRVFCYEHYRRLFSKRCIFCQQNFSKADLVLPLNQTSYCHSHCVSCAICQQLLPPGSKYYLIKNTIICVNNSCLNHIKGTTRTNQSYCSNISISPESSFDIIKDEKLSEIDVFKSNDNEDDDDEETSGSESTNEKSGDSFSMSGYRCSKATKQKKVPRNRTVLSEKQLQILNSYYNMNPKPDALIKEQLVEATGLKPRIIRVWFQNKRCKDKKKMISEEINKSKISDLLTNSEPMLVQSPLKLNINATPIKIQKMINQNFTDIDGSEPDQGYFSNQNSSSEQYRHSNRPCALNTMIMSTISPPNPFMNTATCLH